MAYPDLPAALATPIGLFVVLILNGYGEEAGWRGYLLEVLLPSLGRFRATMLVAALWLLWHAPLFWVDATMSALVGLPTSAEPAKEAWLSASQTSTVPPKAANRNKPSCR